MNKQHYSVIGLMSGTSLDGLDIAHVNFTFENRIWKFDIAHSQSIDYDLEMRKRLKGSVDLSGLDLLLFDNEFGMWLGDRTREFIGANGISVDFIASHGHTVFHQIDKKLTYQIGSGQELANTSGQKVICDFRTLDVSKNGQGAPLVPIGDKLLFSEFDFCLNLGGIANVSFEKNGSRVAFDISTANMLLNHLMEKLGKSYDENGNLARSGKLDRSLFDELNSLEYFSLPFPKSTGFEWFVDEVQPIIEKSQASIPDKLCTAVHHTAYQIQKHLDTEKKPNSKMLITGGGAKNSFFVDTIISYMDGQIEVVVPEEKLIDFKESAVFALMGVLRMRNEMNCLASVTGATSDSSSGQLYGPI